MFNMKIITILIKKMPVSVYIAQVEDV